MKIFKRCRAQGIPTKKFARARLAVFQILKFCQLEAMVFEKKEKKKGVCVNCSQAAKTAEALDPRLAFFGIR